ncbi:kappaPI-actitoxin-Avd3c-like [Drosophila subobscura]|uniref:kappaPI-actitoxin-Avd3c-like n=1 Tax=Drosophila subobscura TaxID=7241 RepID=UPI00155A9FE9|nr:kappaPI-actitoxin-Avd3c-like [Drosophila subobscura]
MVKLMMSFVFLGLLLCLAAGNSPPKFWERDHICTEDIDYGHCRENQIRWYYDTTSKSCKAFYYSGCGGNYNRFLRKSGCMSYCMDPDYPLMEQ